ncbi:MAG TPA: hypothetical protein VII06_04850 [Chloroflexota bacterium]|jgi:hypothetical protein
MSLTSAPDGREPATSAAPPRARLTHDEAVAKARALAPTLKERAAEAEALRGCPTPPATTSPPPACSASSSPRAGAAPS